MSTDLGDLGSGLVVYLRGDFFEVHEEGQDTRRMEGPAVSREVRKQVSFGDAGQVTVTFNVEWLDLPDDVFAGLRKFVRELEALGEPADPCGFLPLQHDRPRLHDAAGATP